MLNALVPVLLAIAGSGANPIPTVRQQYGQLAEKGSRSAAATSGELALQAGDSGEAFRWFSMAAEQGDNQSRIRLADLYVDGRGTLRNPAHAAHWYALAVNDSPEAQWKLGALFQQGDGVPQNPQIAASMFRRAADQGYADAQNSLASLYIAGVGVKQDFQEGLKWYRKAAAQSCPDALLNLAGLYYHGIGVKQDLAAAREWALKARSSVKAREAEDLLAQIEKARAGARASSFNED